MPAVLTADSTSLLCSAGHYLRDDQPPPTGPFWGSFRAQLNDELKKLGLEQTTSSPFCDVAGGGM